MGRYTISLHRDGVEWNEDSKIGFHITKYGRVYIGSKDGRHWRVTGSQRAIDYDESPSETDPFGLNLRPEEVKDRTALLAGREWYRVIVNDLCHTGEEALIEKCCFKDEGGGRMIMIESVSAEYVIIIRSFQHAPTFEIPVSRQSSVN